MPIKASLLSCDLLNLGAEIRLLEEAGVGGLHIDVMDGNFVPNIAFGIDAIRQVCAFTKLPISVHLMVSNPLQFIDVVTYTNVQYVIIHSEGNRHTEETMERIRNRSSKVGLAINPATRVSDVKDFLRLADLALIMGVHPGYGGQTLIQSTISKIGQARCSNPEMLVAIDGGINEKTAYLANREKADILVVGSYLFDNCSCNRLDCIKEKLKILCKED
ncbi:MAG: ribulose-phosphate 3-epimerase [Holosporales bacterium]|jgi:ribulose-phosphate 3-epimerase|nr:ribulose-phosphate 3-epimerase [Holosporales bacterium]